MLENEIRLLFNVAPPLKLYNTFYYFAFITEKTGRRLKAIFSMQWYRQMKKIKLFRPISAIHFLKNRYQFGLAHANKTQWVK